MRFKMLGSKKAQVASGLAWLTGFIIIFFIMFLFISASLISAGKKKIPAVGVENQESSLIFAKQMLGFLNTETELEGRKASMHELIIASNSDSSINKDYVILGSQNPSEKLKSNVNIFKKNAEEIFSKVMPFIFYSERVPRKELWQIAVFSKKEKRFGLKIGLESAFENFFIAGNLGVCPSEQEVSYADILLQENLDLFFCFGEKEFEESKKK